MTQSWRFFALNTLFTVLLFFASSQHLYAENSKERLSYPLLGYRVSNTYPHDTTLFTQGFTLDDRNTLFESGGGYGKSVIVKRTLSKLQPLGKTVLPPGVFAEGLTLLDDRLYLATWKSGKIHVFDQSLNKQSTHNLPCEMWGLTSDNKNLIMSNGSEHLFFLKPETMEITKKLEVTRQNEVMRNLNELEWVDGFVFANIWHSNEIIVIDTDNGKVIGTLDLTGLDDTSLSQVHEEAVLNGIAWQKDTSRLLVTGKYWSTIYEIELDSGLPARRQSR